MEFCIECKVNQLDGWKKRFCDTRCKQKWYDKKTKKEKKTAEVTYPIYICQHCGHRNQLSFDPRLSHNVQRWEHYECSACGKPRVDNL